jgi:maleylacetoacetate isomerase
LDLKSIPCELVAVNLVNGESESPEHLRRNPLGYVPVLETHQGTLTQSSAIIHWLEDTFPGSPALFPEDPWQHARVLQLADIICADTQPVQNVNVLQLHSTDAIEQKKWAQFFISQGLKAFETLAAQTAGAFSVGETLSWADLCLMPQLYNARRYEVDLRPFPTLLRISSECEKLPSYLSSHPSRYEPA